MWKRVRFLILAAVVIAKIHLTNSQNPRLGGAINVFSRYGYLSISMRVVPRNESDRWIFREPTLDVFQNPPSQPLRPRGKSPTVFEGDFHMEFCDNLRQLLQAYFRDFSFERLDRPWRAFTASWSTAAIARNFGINSSFITGDHCYVLVRVARFRDTQKLTISPENLILDETVAKETDNVAINDTVSVIKFIKNFGSHYISSFVTGNSLYQVFVYTPSVYQLIKERLKTRGVAELSSLELRNYFSPWYAKHIGAIQSASGNKSVEAWAIDRLRVQYYVFTYPSLLKLHGDASLLRQLDGLLDNEALLQLELRTLAPLFKDSERRHWFLEAIDNYFKLWEVNM
ncbi:torso-like protein isoform X2 [Fopius arisanus]|nr:PREDICTED: torso-like protein isoform X2 [Fopius arisanus]XP_011299850.1 PREDICTED: torso-like protein isoform X2 [Fopius arisanus]XP_011299861.1 PREDICTED: torso-like protein isoform X2 [Fopius arisanus]